MKSAKADWQRAHSRMWSWSSTNSGSEICPVAASAHSTSKYSGWDPLGFKIIGLMVNLHKLPQPLQSPIVMVSYVGQRFIRTFGNFTEQEPLETNQFERLSLLIIQSRQALLNHSPPFLNRQAPPRNIHGIAFRDFALADLVPVIETPERKVLPAAQAPVVGILQNPRFRTAFGGVKLSCFVKDFKEDILHHILCLARVTKDSHCNLEN